MINNSMKIDKDLTKLVENYSGIKSGPMEPMSKFDNIHIEPVDSSEQWDGEPSQTDRDEMNQELDDNLQYYMFFQNLKTIKNSVDKILELDPKEVDEILKNGHDWAADHISTSKDDVEEVAEFILSTKENR